MEVNQRVLLFVANVSMAKNIGHRLGGDIYKPENTLYCYKQLIKHSLHDKKLKDIEFDVRETKDKKIVVFHDSKIKRVVPKTKYNLQVLRKILMKKSFDKIKIEDLELSTLKKIKLDNNASIPTLKEVLNFSLYNNVKKTIDIEIKLLNSDKAREDFLQTILRYRDKLRLKLISFRKHFDKSFPYPCRWIEKFKKHNLKVYQIDKYIFGTSFCINSSIPNNYKTILPETNFLITRDKIIEHYVGVPANNYCNKILVGVYNGADNSGDKGLEYFVLDDFGKIIKNGISDKASWEWFTIKNRCFKNIHLILKDNDTNTFGSNIGNGGKIKILVENKQKPI